MKGIVRIFNVLVAICIMAFVLLFFWYLIAWYVYDYTALGTLSYVMRTLEGWWHAVSSWFAGILP